MPVCTSYIPETHQNSNFQDSPRKDPAYLKLPDGTFTPSVPKEGGPNWPADGLPSKKWQTSV